MIADVAVVGAGPAGAATATLLARAGFDVALFDRARFPRDKACGEFVNPGAMRLLTERLGLELKGGIPVDSLDIVGRFGRPVTFRLNPHSIGYSIPREQLDATLVALAVSAGVRLFEGYNVREIMPTRGVRGSVGASEPFECTAGLVIAADGSTSRIARQLGLVREISRLQRFGLVAHFSGVTSSDSGAVTLYPARRPGDGTAGFSPQGEGRAVLAACLPVSAAREVSADSHDFARSLTGYLPGLFERLQGSKIERLVTTSCFGHRLTKPFAAGALFVGDAVEFRDPFTGQGIHHALEGASCAATVAANALHCGDFGEEILALYGRSRSKLNAEYLFADAVQLIVGRPRIARLAIGVMEALPNLGTVIVNALTNTPQPGAKHPRSMQQKAVLQGLSEVSRRY